MFEGMNGSFGVDVSRNRAKNESANKKRVRDVLPDIELNRERKMDIVAACVFCVLGILTIFFWQSISDTLFYQFLYPLLSAGGKVILILIVIIIIVMYIRFRIRHRFRRW